jgi:hypothetical protein
MSHPQSAIPPVATNGADDAPSPPLPVRRVRLDEIHADPKNLRTHDARNVALLAASLHEHGQVEPLVIQSSSGRIIGGHGRLDAMRQLGWRECDVVALDIDDVKARALAIRLNRLPETSGWTSALAETIASLEADGYDPAVLGFDDAEIDRLFGTKPPVDEDESGDDAETAHPKAISVKLQPTLSWVLIGIPVARYGEIDRQIRALAALPGILCETSVPNLRGPRFSESRP